MPRLALFVFAMVLCMICAPAYAEPPTNPSANGPFRRDLEKMLRIKRAPADFTCGENANMAVRNAQHTLNTASRKADEAFHEAKRIASVYKKEKPYLDSLPDLTAAARIFLEESEAMVANTVLPDELNMTMETARSALAGAQRSAADAASNRTVGLWAMASAHNKAFDALRMSNEVREKIRQAVELCGAEDAADKGGKTMDTDAVLNSMTESIKLAEKATELAYAAVEDVREANIFITRARFARRGVQRLTKESKYEASFLQQYIKNYA